MTGQPLWNPAWGSDKLGLSGIRLIGRTYPG
jgi:hypothetical protein